MVRAISAFLDFCYLARRDFHTEDTLREMKSHLDEYHKYRMVFVTSGVRDNLNPPRQHALRHYVQLIQEFGSLNGLCSSITESAHIRAVKKPWRRSNRYNALGQMLKTNSRLEKLRASRVSFKAKGILRSSVFLEALQKFSPLMERANSVDKDDSVVDEPIPAGFVILANTPRE